MTKSQAIEQFLAGKLLAVVEFRSSKAERIKWRDKESRAMNEAPILRHSVEAADGTPYIVNERVAETFDETKFQQQFKKGDCCILRYSASAPERGILHFQGSVELMEPEVAAAAKK